MSRGVLYVVWGEAKGLDRSIDSLRQHHPELPCYVARLGHDATLLDKATMADLTPFDETLFLDADTVVLDRLDYGFEQAARHGLACAICEAPWARRYPSIRSDAIEYNTGVLFFTSAARPIFEQWKALNDQIDSSILFRTPQGVMKMPLNDQAGFALAVETTRFNPFVLPLNWNFRPIWQKSWFGPLKIWHDYSDIPESVLQRNAEQMDPDALLEFVRSQ